ncbi:MAG: hypothetical protein ABSF38_13610 [Verrucomicrobiota bacterium]|jgi:hypothetical protein
MQPDKRILLDDVLHATPGDARRQAILRAGGRIMRRRRACRFAARTLVVLAAVILAALAVHRYPAAPKEACALPPKTAPGEEQVQYLTDDQLLALFPNTPVGLIKTPDGKKRLIFPRPGDEAKYIIHL